LIESSNHEAIAGGIDVSLDFTNTGSLYIMIDMCKMLSSVAKGHGVGRIYLMGALYIHVAKTTINDTWGLVSHVSLTNSIIKRQRLQSDAPAGKLLMLHCVASQVI
jgi:hypothetical protein